MRPTWRRLARGLVRAYPAAWRRRYGDELEALVDEMGVEPRDLIDLARGALRERAALSKTWRGISMTDRQHLWISRMLGLASLAIATPAVLFIGLSVLQYNFGVLVGDSSRWWFEHSAAALTMLGYLGAPLMALGVALLGMSRLSVRREEGTLLVTARVRPSRLTVMAAGLSLLLIAVVVAYGISENLLEALR